MASSEGPAGRIPRLATAPASPENLPDTFADTYPVGARAIDLAELRLLGLPNAPTSPSGTAPTDAWQDWGALLFAPFPMVDRIDADRNVIVILVLQSARSRSAGVQATVQAATVQEGRLPTAMDRLTLRQRQVMSLVLAGHPSKNIAADLGISRRTVENHRAAIMRRTGATSLPALARMAIGASGGIGNT